MKEGERISERTYGKGLWTWTTVRGPIMKVGGRLGGGGWRGGKWDNCNSTNNKIFYLKRTLRLTIGENKYVPTTGSKKSKKQTQVA